MMTKTQIKNGKRIERAVSYVARQGRGVWYGYVTVKQVADEAKMSKPTARKYINMLVESGLLKSTEKDMRYCNVKTQDLYFWVGCVNDE